MSNNVKDINIKKQPYYFFSNIIYVEKSFDPNSIKIDEKWYKKIIIYYILEMWLSKKP